jgi:hypothetical protein
MGRTTGQNRRQNQLAFGQNHMLSNQRGRLVRSRGLEPPRVAPLAPQASASTSSATTASQNARPSGSGVEGNGQDVTNRQYRYKSGGMPVFKMHGIPRRNGAANREVRRTRWRGARDQRETARGQVAERSTRRSGARRNVTWMPGFACCARAPE